MKIVIIEPLGISEERATELLHAIVKGSIELVYYNTMPKDDAEKVDRARDADIVMLANTPLQKAVLEKCPSLKLLSVAFTGVDHIDLAYCRQREITVCNCSGYANEAVSELVFGMAIALYRKLLASDQAVRNGETRAGLVGIELSGKKIGIIGAGAIGQKTAAIAMAFGCEVFAYSRVPKQIAGIEFVSMDEVLSHADILSIHVPLTPETKGMIQAEHLAKMKKTAILINTARGPVVDSAALADALKQGQIAGAAIDVFENEPPIAADHVLLNAPNVLLAPHIGFSTQEAMEKRAAIAFKNIQCWQMGAAQNVM